MRVWRVIGSTIALSATTIAQPHFEPSAITCVPSISTVFATPSAIYFTVTVHDAPTSTIYITIPTVSYIGLSEIPTTTLTQVSTTTVVKTIAKYDTQTTVIGGIATQSTQSYQGTVVKTIRVTITAPYSSVDNNGPLSYYVLNGTTSWLGNKTPFSDSTYVYESNIVTVLPVVSGEEKTTTLTSTVRLISEITVTRTLSMAASRVLSGTGVAFTAYPAGGWNVSVIAAAYTASGYATTGTGTAAIIKPILVTGEPTFDLYPTESRSRVSRSSFAAQSGFKGYTTLTSPVINPAASGDLRTAVIDGQSNSWTISTRPVKALSSVTPPYANSTLSDSRISIVPTTGSSILLSFTKASTDLGNLSAGLGHHTIIPTAIPAASVNLTFTSPGNAAPLNATTCGTTGDFTLNFDDIPPLAIGNQSIDDVAPLPVFNPYHLFDFSNGFTVVPPPRVPYLPSSKQLLLEFIPNFTFNRSNENTGPNVRQFGWSGDIGNRDHGLSGCFSFNMYGASFGCDSRQFDCVFTFLGFRYDRLTHITKHVTSQSIAVPACPRLNACSLTPVTLDSSFQNLDAVRMNVTVGGLPKLWWVDDVRLGWYNNTCSAGVCRRTTRIH